MRDKSTYILIALLLLLISLIVGFSNSIAEKKKFVKPDFEENAVDGIPAVENFDKSVVKINEEYVIYINPVPVIKKGKLLINFTSIDSNKILVKLRVKDSNGNIVGESGILKSGQYVEYLDIDGINIGDEITYVIMGYEANSYLSAGTFSLKTKVGEVNEKAN